MNKIIILGFLLELICGVAHGNVLNIHDFTHARLYHCDQVNRRIVDVMSLKENDFITDLQIQKDSAHLMLKGMERLPKAHRFFIVLEKRDKFGMRLSGRRITVTNGEIILDGKSVKVIELIKDKDLIPKVNQFLSFDEGPAKENQQSI